MIVKPDIDPNKLGLTYEDPDYEIINYVYKYHPYFDDEYSEDIMVSMYKIYGMPLIKNMVYIARESKKIYIRIDSLERDLNECREILEKFKNGKFTVDM